jgi:hypothetical protein
MQVDTVTSSLKRTADPSQGRQGTKAQKTNSGDDVSAVFTQLMEQSGVGLDQFVAFLKSLPSEYCLL